MQWLGVLLASTVIRSVGEYQAQLTGPLPHTHINTCLQMQGIFQGSDSKPTW